MSNNNNCKNTKYDDKANFDKKFTPQEDPQLIKHPFLFLNNHRNKYHNQVRKQVENNSEGYDLESLYFCNQNIDIIQKLLITSVFKNSKGKYRIPFQKKENIIVVMKYIFNFYARNLGFNIKEQIKNLNDKVVKELTSSIIIELEHHDKYLQDIEKRPPLLDRGVNVSSKGNKTLPSVTKTFNIN